MEEVRWWWLRVRRCEEEEEKEEKEEEEEEKEEEEVKREKGPCSRVVALPGGPPRWHTLAACHGAPEGAPSARQHTSVLPPTQNLHPM